MSKKQARKRVLVLGCNQRPMKSDAKTEYVNVDYDNRGLKGIVEADLNNVPWPFKDDDFDQVVAVDILEHLVSPADSMREIHRVLKPNGLAEIMVPHALGQGAFQDPTHIFNPSTKKPGSFWVPNSFFYYSRVPDPNKDPRNPATPLVDHPWKALYPELIPFAFLPFVQEVNPSGILYVQAHLYKLVEEQTTVGDVPVLMEQIQERNAS